MVENTFFFSYTYKLGIVRHRSHAQCSDGVINLSQSPDRSCVNERFALFGSALPLPQFHVSFCNPHIGREGKTPDEYLANDSLFYWQRVIPCIRLKLYLQPAVALWSFPAKLVVPCICASPSISDKGLRCDWAIQQENSESIQITSELLVLVLLNSYSRDSKCTYAPH